MSDILLRQVPKEAFSLQPSSIKFKTPFKNCILKSMKNRNWNEAENENEWDIYWAEKETILEVLDRTHLGPNQKVNHFKNHFELTRKDHLMRNLKKHRRQLEKEGKLEEAAEYNFFPITYNLPLEYPVFCEEFKRNGNSVWIMKPIGKSQGRGIFLFNKLNQISNWKLDNKRKSDNQPVENYVVQKYISNPLLIGGKKFDLRIYCLVTSYSPLVAYLYRDGFARFTHHRYSNHDLNNAYVHLTNVAIQKTSENYDQKLGGKWSLNALKQYMTSKYGQAQVNECFRLTQQLVLKTLQGVQKLIMNDKHCFELYGFDVLLDDQLKPWLLEVNGSPSMTANTSHDAQLKCELLDDVFSILDFEKILTGQEEQIGGFDLITQSNSPKTQIDNSVNKTMLGCLHDRKKLFTKLAKEIIERYKKNKANTLSQSKTMKNPPKSFKKLKENPLNSSLINLPLEKIIENAENPTPRTSTVVQPLALSLSSVSTIETSKTPKNKNIQIPSIHKNTSEPNIQFENQENNRMSTSDIFPPQSKSTPRVKIPLHLPKVTAFKTDDTIKRDSLSYKDAQNQSKLLNNVTNQTSSLKNGIRRALMPIKPNDENNRRSSIPILRPFSPWTTFNWSEKKNVGLDEFKMKPIDEKTLTDCLPTGKIRSGPRRSTPFTLALDENHDVRPSINEKDPIKKVKTFRINKKVKSKEIKTKAKSDKSRMPKVGKKEENVGSIDSIKERSTADNEEERMVF